MEDLTGVGREMDDRLARGRINQACRDAQANQLGSLQTDALDAEAGLPA